MSAKLSGKFDHVVDAAAIQEIPDVPIGDVNQLVQDEEFQRYSAEHSGAGTTNGVYGGLSEHRPALSLALVHELSKVLCDAVAVLRVVGYFGGSVPDERQNVRIDERVPIKKG